MRRVVGSAVRTYKTLFQNRQFLTVFINLIVEFFFCLPSLSLDLLIEISLGLKLNRLVIIMLDPSISISVL